MRRQIAVLVTAALALFGLIPFAALPASGATTGTLTIVAAGGAAENSTWDYNAGLIELSANTSINTSDIEAKAALGALTLFADEIVISASLTYGAHDLTFKSKGSIRMPGGVTITGSGGNLLFQADSDEVAGGEIRLGTLATDNGSISTGGGDISLVGGSDPATGFAVAVNASETGKPAAAVSLYGFDLDAEGGDVIIRGTSGVNNNTISTRVVLFETTNTSQSSSISTSGSGTIDVLGDASNVGHSNAWGITGGVSITSASGDITLTGKGNTASTNARGFVSGSLSVTSTSGDVRLVDTTDGSAANYLGSLLINLAITTGGDASIEVDEFIPDGTQTIDAANFTLKSHSTDSFTASTNLGNMTLTGTTVAVLGSAGNSANLVVNGTIVSDGRITLNTSGVITQSSKLEAAELVLGSSGAVTMNNAANDVDVLTGGTSGNRLGAFSFVDEDSLEIGTVGARTGLYSSGTITISTTSGDLTLSQPVSSSAAGVDSLKLYADKDAAADAAGDGNIKLSGLGSVSVEATSRGLLYSGSSASSTGLTSAVGGSGSTRSSVDATTVLGNISPALGATGLFALYRVSSVPGAPTAVSGSTEAGTTTITLTWTAPTDSGGAAISGYKIEINDGDGWSTQTANTGTAATSATIEDLVFGKSYQFRVSAINSVGTSAASNASVALEILGQPAPPAYTGPLVTNLAMLEVVEGETRQVTVEGIRLDTVVSGTIDGLAIAILSKSDSKLMIQLPSLSLGVKDLVLVSASGNLTHQDAFDVKSAQAEDTASGSKVNAGSFKGYVAIYAKGHEGKRLSAKVGNDWVIVPSLASNFERIVEYTGSGYEINLRIFIDRVLQKTLVFTTK